MYVVRVETMMIMKLFPSFGQMLSRNRLYEEEEGLVIHFVSHQWLSNRHPDPEGVQLRKLQTTWQTFLDNKARSLFVPKDWDSFLQGSSTNSARSVQAIESSAKQAATDESVTEDVLDGTMWIDFCSVPQLVDVAESDETEALLGQQARAIASIPAYVERANYFWVLAPHAVHRDTGIVCNFTTWRNRGWCRLEEWANTLVENRKFPLVITDKPRLSTVGMIDCFVNVIGHEDRSVCAGEFSCCRLKHQLRNNEGQLITVPCDKKKVGKVMEELLRRKKTALLKSGNKFMHSFPVLIRRAVLAQSEVYTRDFNPEETVETYLQRIHFDTIDEQDVLGNGPEMCASMLNHPNLLLKLERQLPGCLTRANKVGWTPLMGLVMHYENVLDEMIELHPWLIEGERINQATTMGYTALIHACGGFPDRARRLLELKASIHHADSNGRQALHHACVKNSAGSVQVLLEHKANVDATDKNGDTPLHLAADGVTLTGHCNDSTKLLAISALLQAHASVHICNNLGETPVDIAKQSHLDAAVALFTQV